MSEELNHETFDLGSVLTGAAFPETDVEVFFNESIGFEIYKAEQLLRQAEMLDSTEEAKDLNEKLENLREEAKTQKFTITLKGVPESTRKICNTKAREKFPPETTLFGTEQADPARDDLFNALMWKHSIVKVTDPAGRVAIPTEEDIENLRNAVGRTAVQAITEGIRELTEGPKSAFEGNAQETSFL